MLGGEFSCLESSETSLGAKDERREVSPCEILLEGKLQSLHSGL